MQQAAHEGDVLRPPVVVVTGDGPVGAVEDATGLSREGVPDAGATAVLLDGALDPFIESYLRWSIAK